MQNQQQEEGYEKFAALALLAAFTLGTVGVAYAVEFKVRGTWRVQFNYITNPTFNRDVHIDKFYAKQRMRTIFEFIASENLRGVLQFTIGNLLWGGARDVRDGGGGLGTDGINIKTRHAFINFKLPNTAVEANAGLQTVALPSAFGSHILDADMAALAAQVPFNREVGLTLGWVRPHDVADRHPRDTGLRWRDEVDVFFGVLPVRLDGASLKPFVAVSRWGRNFEATRTSSPVALTRDATMWHAGLNFRVIELAPVTILGDLNYGSVEWTSAVSQSGWIGLLAVQYAMDRVTPEVFGFYESGEGKERAAGGESNRMPVIKTEGAFGPGVGFSRQTSFAEDRNLRFLLRDALPAAERYQTVEGAVGLWALGFALRDIKSMDKLSHDFVAFYARGTNHKANVNLLTTKDSYTELNFNTRYRIYENLALILELAYGRVHLDDTLAPLRSATLRDANDALTRGVLGMLCRF